MHSCKLDPYASAILCPHMFFLHTSVCFDALWVRVSGLAALNTRPCLVMFLSLWIRVVLHVGYESTEWVRPVTAISVQTPSCSVKENPSTDSLPTLLNMSQPSFSKPTRAWQEPLSLILPKPPENTLPLFFSLSLFLHSLHLTPQSQGANVSHLIAQEFHYSPFLKIDTQDVALHFLPVRNDRYHEV